MTTLDVSTRMRGGTDSQTPPPLRRSVGASRLLAAAVAVQPLLLGFNALFHPEVELTGESLLTAATADPGRWFLVHVVAAVGAFLGVPAAFDLRRLVLQAGRRLATVGVGLTVVGGVLLGATFAVEASVMRLAAEMTHRAGARSLRRRLRLGTGVLRRGRSHRVHHPRGSAPRRVALRRPSRVSLASRLVPQGAVGTAVAAPGSAFGPIAFGFVAIDSLFLSRAIVQAGDPS